MKNTKIVTERLIIIPLNHSQLIKYIELNHVLESELQLFPSPRSISAALKEAIEVTLLPQIADPTKNYLYATLWTIISISKQKMVGDICFTGEPNMDGQIEIGYGTHEVFRNQGLMTEAVGGMIQWAKKQDILQSIFAATEKNNAASSTILERNHFIKKAEHESQYHWILDLNPTILKS